MPRRLWMLVGFHRGRRECRRHPGGGQRGLHQQSSRRDQHDALRPRVGQRRARDAEAGEQWQAQTVGPLGFDLVTSGGFTGFDISGLTGPAYLVGNKLGAGGLTANSLYQVNLATGAASVLGAVSGVNGSFRDMAVGFAVPEPTGLALMLLGFARWSVAGGRRDNAANLRQSRAA